MAVCQYCEREMAGSTPANSCTIPNVQIDGKSYPRIRFGDEDSDWGADRGRCHDCNVAKGGIHHFNCDVERCPKCSHQLLSCDCNLGEEEDAHAPGEGDASPTL